VTERSLGPRARHHDHMRENHRRIRLAFACSVALATAFEVFLLLGTQVKGVMAVTPWQDDPYHAWISLVVFALPMLLVVVALRYAGAWLPWGRSSASGRQRDLAKAGVVLVTFVGATALDCWLSVLLGEHRSSWDARTTWMLIALGVMSAWAPVALWLGLRDLRILPREPDADWVGDVMPAPLAAWVRRHDRIVFLTASVVAAVVIIGTLAYGERWTDPLLIGWGLAVEITCYYAFCVITNAVLGFIDRPDRDGCIERAFVLASVALQAAVAMHGQLEPLVGTGAADGVGRLVEVTVAPGLVVFGVAFEVLRLRPATPARPAR
jgi:hypothetical protein